MNKLAPLLFAFVLIGSILIMYMEAMSKNI
jgi:hypothetical protein